MDERLRQRLLMLQLLCCGHDLPTIVESRKMNPTSRVLILMALSLLLALTIPVIVTASTF
jgi:hypothetical protein